MFWGKSRTVLLSGCVRGNHIHVFLASGVNQLCPVTDVLWCCAHRRLKLLTSLHRMFTQRSPLKTVMIITPRW